MTDFGNWLLALCAERDWNAADLARRSGLSQPVISRIVNGERKAGVQTCRAIAHAFGIPIDEVYRRAGLLPPARAKTERVARIIAVIEELPEHEQDFLEEWVRLRLDKQRKRGRTERRDEPRNHEPTET